MYCGLGTTGNKVRWTLAALFLLLAVLAAIGIGITKGICDENLEDARDQIQSGSGSGAPPWLAPPRLRPTTRAIVRGLSTLLGLGRCEEPRALPSGSSRIAHPAPRWQRPTAGCTAARKLDLQRWRRLVSRVAAANVATPHAPHMHTWRFPCAITPAARRMFRGGRERHRQVEHRPRGLLGRARRLHCAGRVHPRACRRAPPGVHPLLLHVLLRLAPGARLHAAPPCACV